MAKERRKDQDKGAWDRWKQWVRRNERVVMVLLLMIIAPSFAFTGLFYSVLTPNLLDQPMGTIYGEEVTQGDLQSAKTFLEAVTRFAPEMLFEARLSLRDQSPLHFLAYREKALRSGIRVTDEELGERILAIWRRHEAAEHAQAELAKKPADPKDQVARFEQYREFQRLFEEKEAELKRDSAFDKEKWASRVSRTGLRLREFEEKLRDLLLVAKLEAHVLGSVQITPEEVYKEYREEDQKRKLSWVELKPSDVLKEKIARGVKENELEAYYEARLSDKAKKNPFTREFALRATYVLIPSDHFKEGAAKAVTEEELERYFEDHRNDYRRAVIHKDESLFALRTPDEKAAYEAAIYLPLEEVKDKVREKVIEEKTQRELEAFSGNLRGRLYPDKAPPVSGSGAESDSEGAGKKEEKKPATLAELAKEFPFLKTGTTEFATAENAEEVFGEAYTGAVRSWFSRAAREGGGKATRIDPPDSALKTEKPEGRIFFTRVETRAAGVWRFKEIKDKVKEEYVAEEALRLIKKALDQLAGAPDKAGGEGAKELSSLVASGELEVEVQGEKVMLKVGPLATSSTYVARSSRGGVLKVWKAAKKEDKEDGPQEGETDSAKVEELADEELEEVSHAESASILPAGFSIQKVGELASAVGETEQACYLVRLDGIVYPDAAAFDKRRDEVETELLQETQEAHFVEWRKGFFEEALGAGEESALALAGTDS